MVKRFLMAMVGAALVAGLMPLGGAAQAGQCDPEIYVFTQTGVFLPEGNPTGYQSIGNPTIAPNYLGCVAKPDVEANTNLVYPGATLISSRWLSGVMSGYCFEGVLLDGLKCGPARVSEGLVPGSFYSQSPRLALDPTKLGCVEASFDGRGHVEYCTVESRP